MLARTKPSGLLQTFANYGRKFFNDIRAGVIFAGSTKNVP